MKRTAVVIVGLGLLTGALVAPATAKKAAKPAATTLYLHGNYHVGDGAEFAGSIANGTHMMMDGTEPAAGAPKSMSYSTPIGNVECAGNPLFPSWDGKLAGKITSDVKLIGHFVSPGSKVIARVWLDVPFSSCTSSTAGVADFKPPVAEVEVQVPAGHNEVEIVLPGLKGKKMLYGMVIELHQTGPGQQGRVLYDSPEFASRVEFTCQPKSGSSCITG